MSNLIPHLSVVSPVHGAASLLPELVARIHATVSKLTDKYEIILVDDSSTDLTLLKAESCRNDINNLKIVQAENKKYPE